MFKVVYDVLSGVYIVHKIAIQPIRPTRTSLKISVLMPPGVWQGLLHLAVVVALQSI